jgi:hypothetical protein
MMAMEDMAEKNLFACYSLLEENNRMEVASLSMLLLPIIR